MKTTAELESKESKSPERVYATEKGTRPPDGFPDPDFAIEGTGGPSDGSGGSYTGPPPKEH